MVKRNFLYKMLSLYLGIVLLYTTLTSTITLYKGFQLSSLQATHSNELYIGQQSNYIDSKLQIAFEFVYKISTLNSFIDYRYSPEANYIYITELFNDLSYYLQSFSKLGFTFGITKLTDNMVISPSGTYTYPQYLEELGIDAAAFYTFKNSQNTSLGLSTYVVPSSMMNSSKKLVLIHQMTMSSKNAPVYFFIVLDTNMLLTNNSKNALGDFSLYTDEFIGYLANQPEITDTDLLITINNTNLTNNINNIKIDNTLNYIYSSQVLPHLKYVYTTGDTSLLPILMSILKKSLLPGLLLFLIGIWLSYKAAKSTYKPIKDLVDFVDVQTDLHTSFPNEEATTELAYLESSIKHIYSVNHTLKNKLDQSEVRLQEDFFRKVIYGIVDEKFIEDNLKPLQLTSFNNNLRLLLLDYEGIENLSSFMTSSSISSAIYEILEEAKRLTTDFFILPLDTKKYCIILNDTSEETLFHLGNYIIDAVVAHLSLDVTVCISSSYQLDNLSFGLQELLMLNNYKYATIKERILTTETIKTLKETVYYYPLETETCLINYISTNERSKAKDLLSELIEKNLADMTLSSTNITNLKYSLITTFKRCLNVDGKSLNQFIKEHPSAIDEFLDIPLTQFRESTFTLFDIIFNYCNQNKFSLENSTASNIFMYIHENFDKDISLTDIANHFGLSESYISKLFKSSLDINFKTYVNKLKIKKAKELLSQGNYKVNEVATIIGCNNANTFIRIFKQYEGVSPGEYVKSINKLSI